MSLYNWRSDPIPVRYQIDAAIAKDVEFNVSFSIDQNTFAWFRRNIVGAIGEPIKNKMTNHITEEFNR